MKVQANKVATAYNGKETNKIVESWSPMIKKITGVDNAEKLEWMSQLAHNTAKLNEDAFQMGSNQFANMGGGYYPFNNLYNTVGVGDVVAPTKAAMTGGDFADPRINGSGDKFPALLPLALKVAAKTIGFELVNTVPMPGPSGVLPYMDYVYSGSKQPFGATPAHDVNSRNPRVNSQSNLPYEMYGLPHAFKAAIAPGQYVGAAGAMEGEQNEAPARIKRSLKGATAMPAGTILTSAAVDDAADRHEVNEKYYQKHIGDAAGALEVEFIGWSRVDGDPMFKVLSGTQSLGSYFNQDVTADGTGALTFTGKYTPVGSDTEVNLTLKLAAPRLISMLEDSIQGFAGAGPADRDAWYGTYQDGTVLYEPMSRGVGEQTPPRQISLQLFTKNVTVGTIEVGCGVTQEQVQDLQKQWGIDVVKMVENAAINQLSETINRHITSRLFALGWKNHYKMVEVEGPSANLNISLDPTYTPGSGVRMTPSYAIPQNAVNDATGTEYAHQVNVALPYKPLFIPAGAAFENRDTLIKRIATNLLAASNWILQRGRYGAATFAVTNITIATLLQSNAQYQFSPIANTISQAGGQLYPIGQMAGMTIYVDPLMAGSDNRVLVGRKGDKSEPGCIFCPYILAETFRTIAETTMAPKLMVKSRYALVDAGFFPHLQYVTFCVDPHGI